MQQVCRSLSLFLLILMTIPIIPPAYAQTPSTFFLSDLAWVSATNGIGPVERDQANGGEAAGDGAPIVLDGIRFPHGLGVSAESELIFDLAGRCNWLAALAGVEDGATATAIFSVIIDGKEIFNSGLTRATDPAIPIDRAIDGAQELRLRMSSEHTDKVATSVWADARVVCTEPPAEAALPTPTVETPILTPEVPSQPTIIPVDPVQMPAPDVSAPAMPPEAPMLPTAIPADLPTSEPAGIDTLAATNATPIAAWSRWEQRLTSSRNYASPLTEVTLQASFHGPNGATFTSDGFWDGGTTFVIRALFASTGSWSWTTSSSDPGLNGRSGTVQVSAATSSVALLSKGKLRAATNGRFLTYANGVPFFWLGDTVWDAALRASDTDWANYLTDRANKRFTVVQMATAPSWATSTDRQGNLPFTNANLLQPNPSFWQGLDRKIEAANARGLVVLLVGLMDPLDTQQTNVATAQRIARYIAARLAGNHVIFSPSFDHAYSPIADTTAQAIRLAAPQQLVIQHPGTPSGQATNTIAEQYARSTAVQLLGNQTGHNGGNRALVFRQAVTWNLSLWRRTPPRPVINLEAWYDAGGRVPTQYGSAYQGSAFEARAAGYLSLLSGASGYTYGAYGLWAWDGRPFYRVPWQTALQYPSSHQMMILREVFSSTTWWQLEPGQERIRNQSSDDTRPMVFALSTTGTAGMAYLPDNPSIQIDMRGFRQAVSATWVNPTTGQRILIGSIANTGITTFTRPGSGDWALLFS